MDLYDLNITQMHLLWLYNLSAQQLNHVLACAAHPWWASVAHAYVHYPVGVQIFSVHHVPETSALFLHHYVLRDSDYIGFTNVLTSELNSSH